MVILIVISLLGMVLKDLKRGLEELETKGQAKTIQKQHFFGWSGFKLFQSLSQSFRHCTECIGNNWYHRHFDIIIIIIIIIYSLEVPVV